MRLLFTLWLTLAIFSSTALAQFDTWPPKLSLAEEWTIKYDGKEQTLFWAWQNQDEFIGVVKRNTPDTPFQRISFSYYQAQDTGEVLIRD